MSQNIATSASTVSFPTHSTGIVARFVHAIAVRRQRIELSKMDDHRLQDLGITRAQADAEAARSFWDAPQI